MNAIRTYAEVKNHEVRLVLPKTITSKKVEVIIIPLELENLPKSAKSVLNDLQKLLLAAPDMSDEEYNLILEKRKSLNQWN